MMRIVTAAAVVAGLVLVAGPATAQPDPAPAQPAPAGSHSVFRTMPDDPLAVVLGSPQFPVHGDGVGDDTAALQAAIDEASRRGGENWLGNIVGGARGVEVGDGGGVVFIPAGTYRVSETINLHDSVRLVGFGEQRPTILLGPDTPGFQDGTESYVIASRRYPYDPDRPLSFGNNDTFGTGLLNLDIRIAEGNPAAVGVRFSGAQLFLMQDVDIDVGDGYAGISRNANLLQRVRVRGGEIGWLAFAATPGWQTTLLDASFEGQRDAAITLGTDAKLSIIRTRFADAPHGIRVDWPNQWQHLYVQDSVFEDISEAVVTLNDPETFPAGDEIELVQAQNQLNLLNTGVAGAGALLRFTPSGRSWLGPGRSYLVDEATVGVRVEDALSDRQSRTNQVLVAAHPAAPPSFQRLLTSDIPLPPPSESWVNIAAYAAARGVEIGTGIEDDHAIFQQAIDEHGTVYVPMGQYLIGDTLLLRPGSNLVALHPRQTWLLVPDGDPAFSDPDRPRAMIETPPGGRNIVMGLGLDTAQDTPGAVQVRWRSGPRSHLADVTTQFVKWHPAETEPGNPGTGDPGYQYRGAHKYGFWIDGGGGTFANLWSVAGWAENGLLIENTSIPSRMYEVSVEHHEHREVVLRDVRHWQFHALQTEDHIYGWRSQAVELDRVRDILFGNTVFFRVATVLGPHPQAIGIRDSADVVVRGTRGYRDVNVEHTRWGATIADVETGRSVPDLEVAYLGVDAGGRPAEPTGVRASLTPASAGSFPGEPVTARLTVHNDGPGVIDQLALATSAPEGWTVDGSFPAHRLRPGETAEAELTVRLGDAPVEPHTELVTATVSFRSHGDRLTHSQLLAVQVGGENLARGAAVTASSVLGSNAASNAVDGVVDGGRWISAADDPSPTLTIDIGRLAELRLLRLYSGVAGGPQFIVRGLVVEAEVDGGWREIGRLEGNQASPADLDLGAARADRLRLVFTEPSQVDTIARVFEVEVYGRPVP